MAPFSVYNSIALAPGAPPSSCTTPSIGAGTRDKSRQRAENDVTLALLKAGVPSAELLVAKNLEALLDLAQVHDVTVQPTHVVHRDSDEEAAARTASADAKNASAGTAGGAPHEMSQLPQLSPPTPTTECTSAGQGSAALTRARAWRFQNNTATASPPLDVCAAPPPAPTPSGWTSEEDERAGAGTYDGERNEAGEREGRGVYRFADGGVYEGEWKGNLQEGRGVMWYASGSVYTGEWSAGTQEGRGLFRFASGSEYDGMWKGGQRHGKATYRCADGRAEVATYKDGANDRGEGAMWSADRRVAWRILRDGEYVEEISLAEARSIAERIGEPVPPAKRLGGVAP
jgi:hypothetical protein